MRFIQICWILTKYLVLYKFTRHRRDIFGMRLKIAFEELGITFIKIGQILSMRYDLLARPDAQALQALLDKVKPIPLAEIYRILEAEYKTPWQNIFRRFENQPLGSASVSQVHKAELFDGSVVAVKIKRPNVDSKFAADIRVMKFLAATAERFSRVLRNIQVRGLVDYFEAWIKQDLDFRREVQSIKKVKEQYKFAQEKFRADLGTGIIPAVFEGFCTDNIVVMEFIDGIPLSNKQEVLSRQEYDVEKSIKSFVNAAMRNWFREDTSVYYFQADPHLSNILALPGGSAASIDFGLIAELSRKEADICADLIIAVYLKDLSQSMKVIAQMLGQTPERCEVMRPDIARYLEQTSNEGFGFWFLEVAKICNRHGLKFPLYMTTFGRTNLLIDGMIHEYLPDHTTVDLLGEELQRQAVKVMWRNVVDADWMKLSYVVSRKINEGPGIVSEFLDNPLGMVSKIINAAKN